MHLLIGFVCLIQFFRIGEGGSCYEDRCSRNSVLKPGSFIKSTNNLFTFILQENGKLEILCGMSSIWIASCSDDNVKEFSFQEDGNLIVYRNDNSVAWNAGLTGRAPKGSKLIMQNDGNLVMYDDNDVYVWSIVTFNKCPAVDGKYGNWSEWTTCTKSCGGGLQRRMRICNNPPPFGTGKNCEGPSFQIQSCSNNFCEGPAGVSGAQVVVKKIIDNFHKIEFPDKKPSGKFLKAIFAIQEAVSQEFISVDPTVTEKTLDERLKDLEGFLIVAVDGGSIDFARTILGKGLFTFTKQKMKEGLPIVDIHTTEKRQFHRVVREIGDKKMETLLSAAQKYLDKLRKEIGDKKMDKILSAQGYSTLIFAIDTTGSMSAEINAAKAIAKQIINVTRESEVDYILSPFNDPGTGPVTYRSGSDRSLFVSDIDGLRASGGGDCPELAFTGMLNALEEGPEYGSPMFVFTDASAKDANSLNKAALKASADLSDITITFFTNLNGCSATEGIKDYEEIARHTEGNIFPLQNESELVKFTEFVNVSLRQDTVVASGGTITETVKRSASSSHGFAVDDGISTVIVSVVVSNRNMASQVSLFDPDNIKVNPQATTSMSIIFQIMNPKPGRYQLTFPNTVGEYEYNVQGVSEKAIEFTTSFIYQQSVLKNSPPISITSPFKGIENTMVVRIGGVNRINVSSIRVDFVDTQGKVLQANILTDKLDSDDVRNATIVPPAGSFKVKLSGKTTSGFNFERISRGVIRAITGYLRPIFAGYDFTAKIGGGPVTVQMQYINKGPRESIKFQAKAKFGAISNPNQTKVVRSTTFILFSYTPPNSSSKKGKTDRITVTSTKSTGETFSQQVSILLLT